MDHAPHDVAFVFYVLPDDVWILMEIPEDCIRIAKRQGWSVLIRDSEMPPQSIEPSQSNPRRTEE